MKTFLQKSFRVGSFFKKDDVEVVEDKPLVGIRGKKNKRTKLPMGQLLSICFVLFCEAYNNTFIVPFVGYMILDFGIVDDPSEVGYYTGLISASFYIGQFFSGFILGYLADKVGKKWIILFGQAASVVFTTGFGFSVNFWMAIGFRSLQGIVDGNVSTAKAYIGDITDGTNQAMAFALAGFSYAIGAIIGPVVGGFLARPAINYPNLFKGTFFEQFAYILPALVCAIILTIGIVIALFYLKTNPTPYDSVNTKSLSDVQLQEKSIYDESIKLSKKVDYNKSKWQKTKDEIRMILKLLSTRDCVCSTLIFFLTTLGIQSMTFEMFPLFAILRKEEGGLEFSTFEIGIVQALIAFVFLFQQILIYPICTRLIGKLNTFRIGSLVAFLLIPTPQMALANDVPWLLWTIITIYCIVRSFAIMLTLTSSVILVNNSAPANKRGVVIGLSTSYGCFSKGTEVFMSDGTLKEIEKIKGRRHEFVDDKLTLIEGDKVLGPDSNPREVISTTNGKDEMYEVCQRSKHEDQEKRVGIIKFECNSKHLIHVITKQKFSIFDKFKSRENVYHAFIEYFSLKEIKLKDGRTIEMVKKVSKSFSHKKWGKTNAQQKAKNFLKNIDGDLIWNIEARDIHLMSKVVEENTRQKVNPILLKGNKFEKICIEKIGIKKENVLDVAYLLGIWIGNGYSNQPEIVVDINDIDEIKRIQDIAKNLGLRASNPKRTPKKILENNQSGIITINFGEDLVKLKKRKRNNVFWELIEQLNFINNKNVPLYFSTEKISFREHFLAGLIDSDGHVEKSGRVIFASIYPKVMEGVVALARSLGIKPSVSISNEHVDKNGTCHKQAFYIQLKKSPELFNVLSLSSINRKRRKKPENVERNGYRIRFTVKKIKQANYYGFALSEKSDKLFMLKNNVVVHNCLSKATGPLLGGFLLAWSSGNGLPFPININFPFILVAIISLASFFVSLFLTRSIDEPKKFDFQ